MYTYINIVHCCRRNHRTMLHLYYQTTVCIKFILPFFILSYSILPYYDDKYNNIMYPLGNCELQDWDNSSMNMINSALPSPYTSLYIIH